MNESIGRRAFLTAAGAAAGVAAGGAVLVGADRAAAGAPVIPTELRPGGAFDQYVRGLTAEDAFSGSVALVHQGRTVLERGYGMADRARSVPNRPGTIFSLASVTKFLTSVAIAQLVQRGKLAYTDTVGKHLDGFRDDVAGTVTVHHLLTHTSGLGDYLQIEGFWDELPAWDTVEKAWQGTLRYARRDTLAFAPGAGQRYSNTGFVTLGAVVAAASGRSYYDQVREGILRVSGTTGSDFYTTPRWRTDPRFAHPYLRDGSDQIERHGFVGSPAGGSFATAGDMARIVAALLGGRLLDRVHADLSTSPKLPLPPMPGGGDGRMGFSNYLTVGSLVNGRWVLGHSGGAPGVSTNFSWYPDAGWTVVVLSNLDGAANQVAAEARSLILA
ncbi:serine hydrolase domain-containing protein [Phytohabitans sp. LJ34]|uniref:serine hydrolase domain-containing protein n=1 Tax=Phytohabitans sp. LJ34 TaxID=3452217 RepID=UPI003F8C0B62